MSEGIKTYTYKGTNCSYKYIRIYELPQDVQKKFQAFLGKTCRGLPAPEYEKGPCAWIQDYNDFIRGADPYEGFNIFEKCATEYTGLMIKNFQNNNK